MLIKVKVKPKSKKDSVIKKAEDEFIVEIKEKPERGLANERALNLLANFLEVDKKKLRIIKGGKERSKIIEIR